MNPSKGNSKQPKNNAQSSGNPSKINAGAKVTDPRFDKVNFDPKFMPMAKKQKKIEVDDRFKSMINDTRFSAKPKADKYGRKNDPNEKNKELADLYYVKGQEDDEEEEDEFENDDEIESEEEEAPVEPAKKSKKDKSENNKHENKKQKKSRPQKDGKPQIAHFDKEGKFEWDEESSGSEIDVAEMQKMLEGDEEEWASEDEEVPLGDATKRIAMVNYDWEHISPGDIMLYMTSFCPKNGFIKSVSVYPSDFGLERMKLEATQGPTDIWKGKTKATTEDDQKKLDKTIEDADTPWVYRDHDDNDLDPAKLRRYEKDKLKYYYAVIECDTVLTAKRIYEECEGLEIELTAIKIDLRYIPDSLKFPHKPKEVCTEIPLTSKVHNFLNRALQHTNVKLTWEEPKLDRFDPLLKNVKNGDFGTIDFSQMITSESDSDSDEEHIELKRKALLGGKSADDAGDWRSDFDKSKKKKQMERDIVIKFNPGFDEDGNKILEKPTNKKNVNDKRKNFKANEEDDFFMDDEGEEVPNDKKFNKKEKVDKNAEKKYKDELTLMVDDVDEKKGFKLNLNDDRFKSFTKSEFAIDPTSKYYDSKKNNNLLQEQVNLRRKKVKTN